MSGTDLYAEALAASEAGLSVVPPAEDGTKQPITAWKLYQTRRPTAGQLATWYRDHERSGIGYVLGAVSGNRECLEFDCPETWQAFRDTAEACGLDTVVERIVDGYCDATPGGGVHLLYQCDEIGGNEKLARRPKRPEEMRDGHDKVKVKIETRGEGGFVISAPSNGRVHPTGKPYVRLSGGPATIARVTPEERSELFALARAFDEMPKAVSSEPKAEGTADGTRPGDEFNRRADWPAVLEPHGWRRVYGRGQETYWRRPGKDRGVSATTNYAGSGLLYVFTSSTVFEPERSYTPFGAHAVLEYGGDFAAAARALGTKERQSREQATAAEDDSEDSVDSVLHAWPEIMELGDVELPAFPIAVLPDWQQQYVRELAEATQTPPDLPAMMTQDAIGASVAKKVVVEIRDGWVEPLNRYSVTALRSGERKTAVHQAVVKPIDDYEAGRALDDVETIARAENDRRVTEQALARAQKEAANATGAEREALILAAQAVAIDLAKSKVPAPTCLLADDISPEKVASVLAEQGGRLAILSDEGGIFDLMAGRYNDKAPNLDVFLKGHAGGTVRVKRIGRPDDYVPGAALTIGLAVQPAVIAGLAEHPSFRGKGLLARFAYGLPKSRVGGRTVNATPMTVQTRHRYHARLTDLLKIELPDEPHGLHLDEAADRALAAFEAELEPRLSEFGDCGHIADWAGKLAGLTARHAAHFHLAEHASDSEPWATIVLLATMRRAIRLSRDYLIPHALAAFALMGADPAIGEAQYVLRWMLARPEPTKAFTKRDLYQTARGRFKRVDLLDAPLGVLVHHGYIRKAAEEEKRGPGRKPSPTYDVNPSLVTHNPHNTQNQNLSGQKGNSGDSVHCV